MDSIAFPAILPAFRIEHQCQGVVASIVGTADDLVRANLRAMCALRDLIGNGAEGNLVVIDQRSAPRDGIAGIHRIDEYRRCHAS